MRIEHWFYTLPLRLRSLFRREQVEQELHEELQYHLDQKADEYRAQGLSSEQARQTALRAMYGLTQRKEECRDMRQLNAFEDVWRDIYYGCRMLKRSPGFMVVAVLTLALAIGANVVVFGVLSGLILRPLNVPRAGSLYSIHYGNDSSSTQSYPDYLDFRDRNRSFEDLAAFNIDETALDTGEKTSTVWTILASGNYFDVLGIQPYLGRFFRRSDEHGPNSAPYLVLNFEYWHSHFLDDRGVVGRVVRINKHPLYDSRGCAAGVPRDSAVLFPDIWMPLVNQEQVMGFNLLNDRKSRWLFMTLGHLRTGVTVRQATADLNSVSAYLEKTYPKFDPQTTFALGRPSLYGDFVGRPARAFLAALMLLAGLILLAACFNLGSLFAARAADRSREVALRLALGSSRGRILRGLLTEALLISCAGGAAGLFGSVALLRILSVWRPIARFPIHMPVRPDASVYAVALGLAIVSGILFGIVPVRQVLRTDPYDIIKSGSRTTGGSRITVRELLIGLQIAICAVLVVSSVVALRGLLHSMHSNFGFEPRNASLVETDLNMAGYFGAAYPVMQRRILESFKRFPA